MIVLDFRNSLSFLHLTHLLLFRWIIKERSLQVGKNQIDAKISEGFAHINTRNCDV